MRKRGLFIAGGWEGHTPFESAALFAGLLQAENFETEVSDSLDVLADRQRLSTFDLIVPVWSMGSITHEQCRGLVEAIEGGAGIAGWHGTMGDAFRESVDYQFMIGGQWVAHPGDMIDYTVHITDREHPITEGLTDFQVHSEQYYMHVDPAVRVLATTAFTGDFLPWIDGVVMPVVWTRSWGAGRVAYCSLGHDVAEFEVPEVREIVRRSLLWASR